MEPGGVYGSGTDSMASLLSKDATSLSKEGEGAVGVGGFVGGVEWNSRQ